ncbi:MAG: hypothetical protein HYX52_06585 [Chloroflexi bacterium]|nr:hypothetical protein [Chloroflexota bacterium]
MPPTMCAIPTVMPPELPLTPPSADPVLDRIVDALEQIRAEEFDYEILQAASEVLGDDQVRAWRPSLSYLPPERRGDEYHVTVYAQGACESCPVKQSHVGTIEPKVQLLVGMDNIVVHDYFDMFDFGSPIQFGD